MHDSKKVQSMINHVGWAIQNMRTEMIKIQTIKTKFTTANPDITGTPLDGKVTALNTAINDLMLIGVFNCPSCTASK